MLIPGGSLHVGYSLAEGDVHYDCVVVNASLFNDWLHDPLHIQFVAPYLEEESISRQTVGSGRIGCRLHASAA
ncbi:hypothetical protein VQ056_13390 [Paenibacillus sp. JTLBN-2024]